MDVRGVLAERVRRQRMSLGLNQTELAEQTGIPYQVISRVEHGHQSLYVERLVELATALKVSLDYLVGRTDDPTPMKRTRTRKPAPVG
jgi:transcriptional regulator with XRE-family HTH domain